MTGRRNFTGKSSLLKIIPFALFGKVDGINKSGIVNWKNKKQTEVILTFEKNGVEYIIHRGIKPDIFNVMRDGVELPQSSNKKVFQQEIEDTILQMDFTTFMNIVYCDTNNSVSILNASKPVKRDYIEKLFNLSYFTTLKDITNTKKKSINAKIVDIDSDIKSCQSKISLSSENKFTYIRDMKRHVDEMNILNGNLKPVKEDTDFTKELKDVRIRQEQFDKDLSKKKILLEKVKAKGFFLSKFKVDGETSQDDIYNQIDLVENTEIVVEKLEKEIESVDVYELDACIEEAKINLDEHNGILRVCKFDVDNLSKEITKLEKELKSKPKDGKCPTCLQKVDFKHIKSEYKTIITEKQEGIVTINKSIIDVEKDIADATKIYDDLKTKRSDYDSLVVSLSNEESKQKSYTDELNKLTMQLKQQNKVVRFQRANKKLDVLMMKIMNEVSNTPSLKKYIEALEKKIEEHNIAYKEYTKIAEKIKGIESNRKTLEGYLSDATNLIDIHTKSLDEFNKMLKKYNDMLEYVKFVIVLCGDEKCKQYAISNFLPYFNDRINHYLTKFGVLFYIRLSGFLDYDILGPGIHGCSYDNLSGAERVSVDMSIQLASIDVKRTQSSSLIDVLILDEILDSSMDTEGTTKMMEVIKSKQIEDKSKVLIVSHKEEIGVLNNVFDYKYEVEMDKYSTIKEI